MSIALEHVLRHHAWANRALLEHCAALGPAALDLEAAGTYGTPGPSNISSVASSSTSGS